VAVAAPAVALLAAVVGTSTALAASSGSGSGSSTHAAAQQAHFPVDTKLLAVVAAVFVLVVLDWLVIRRKRRLHGRPRRRIPRVLLYLLAPIYRYDKNRDAWILRAVGTRYGPVLRPTRHRRRGRFADADIGNSTITPTVADTRTPNGAPDPFRPKVFAEKRHRRGVRSATRQDGDPPPLTVRRPPD
jgi:hypothetical protein